MATVHLGRLLGAAGFSRTVAIKRLHDGYARDPEFVAMLLDEARLASNIRHPNVVPTLDVASEQDLLLVVMEYIEGDSLAHLIKLTSAAGGRVPIPIAAAIVAQSLHGLHAAHEAKGKNGEPLGIVHRDVSPQNVLVGVDGVARVLDFGIAKAASRATSTEDGQLKGKTAYMAPEQLQHGPVDRRTDIFAASIMLWELLTGRRLFLGDSPAQTMSRIMTEIIESPQRFAPEVPLELALVTMRGLERDPDARFGTAEEMALAIEDALLLPRAKEIGGWVAQVAAATVAARRELVREIERVSAPMQTAADTDPELRRAMEEAERRRQLTDLPTDVGRPAPAHGSGPVSAQFAMASTARGREAEQQQLMPRSSVGPLGEVTDLATVRSSASFAPAQERASRLSLVIGIFGSLALVAAIAFVVIVTRDREPQAAKTDAPPQPTALALPEPPPPAIASAPPPASASASPAPSAATPSKKHPVAPHPPSNNGASPKADCRIPYVVDDKGLKHFKVECL